MPLKVLIVGAGIAGLATAIGFAKHGHQVQVFERRPASDREQSGSGIQLQPNAVKILERWGMMPEVKKVTHDNLMATWRLASGEIIARTNFKFRGPRFYGLRSVYKDLFRHFALEKRVEIHEDVEVTAVDPETATITLADGTRLQADLVIGADGANSKIRRLLFPEHKLHITEEMTLQIILPLALVESDPELQPIVDGVHNMMTIAPGFMAFTSIVPHQGKVDIQLVDMLYGRKYEDDSPNGQVYDLSRLKLRFQEYPRDTRKAIELADSAFKWRVVEVFGLPDWSRETTVLLGDAAHAMIPHAGQGTAMGIEDAAMLSELFSDASSGDDLRPAIKQYETLRQSRYEKVSKLARRIANTWKISDPQQIEARNAAWRASNDVDHIGAEPDENAHFASPSFTKWLDDYDVFEVAAAIKRQNSRLSKI